MLLLHNSHTYMQEVSCVAIILYTSARSFSAESNDVSIK